MPVGSGHAAVWCNLPAGLDLVEIEGPRGALTPVSRHRILSAKNPLRFYLVPAQGLQDGLPCEVRLTDGSGEVRTLPLVPKLATWGAEGLQQILSFVVTRLLPKFDAWDHGSLDRYLSLLSAWRLPVHRVADLTFRSLVNLPITLKRPGPTVACLLVTEGKIVLEHARALPLKGGTGLLIRTGEADRGYAIIGDDLAELDLAGAVPDRKDGGAWLQDLSDQEAQALGDALSLEAHETDVAFPRYLAARLQPAALPLAEPDAEFRIAGCLHIPGRIVVLAEMSGTLPLDELHLRPFGADPAEPGLSTSLLSAPTAGSERALPTMALALLADSAATAPIACRIDAVIGGQTLSRWVRVENGATGRSLDLIRSLWRSAPWNERFIAEVASPLASAWAQASVPARPVAPQVGAGALDLHVVGEALLEPVHRTLLGLRASLGPRQSIRLSLRCTDPGALDRDAFHNLLDRYGLAGNLEILASDHPPSSAGRPRNEGSSAGSLLIRAGFIPPCAGWLDEVLRHLKARPDTALLGSAPGRGGQEDPGSAGEMRNQAGCPLQGATILRLLPAAGLAALAVPNALLDRLEREQPSSLTVEGAWMEAALQLCLCNDKVVLHPALAFWNTDEQNHRDAFALHVDAVGLRRRYGAVMDQDARKGTDRRSHPEPSARVRRRSA